MFVRKCDLCKIETENLVVARLELSGAKADLCKTCGEPVLKFLRKNKFIDKNDKEIKKS